jgi:putative nucleotidyltransferase with HDIG domain
LRYEAEETARRRTQAREGVADFEGLVLKDERIIDAHERITASHIERLESLRHAAALRSGQEGTGYSGRTLLGRLLLSVLVTAGFALFLAFEHPKILADTPKVLLLALYGSLSLACVAVALGLFGLSPYIVPMAAAPILVAMTVDARLAVPAMAALSVLVGALGGLGIPFVLVSIASGYAGIVSVRRLNKRRDFYRSVLSISAATVFALGGLALVEGDSAGAFLRQGAWGVLAALVSVIFVSFLLPVVEAAFGVATDISLLELADLNRPLLRRMMIEAPGTYHHSMVVGQLAEAAADAVGGDPLLARVMAYYHDIGKIEKPEYFVENITPGMRNRHERLTPTMSCLILESHVKEGIELARKERLPRALVSAIPEHHGTTLMSFFYHKAQESDETIDEQDYRYPGPVPRSKETAILMLADGVEAASRALADPTPSRIRAVVKQIVDQRGREEQLDECNLTMGELAQVRESFVRVLTGIFHGRIRYPQPVALDEAAPSRPAGARGGNGGDLPRKRAEKD